MAQGLEGHSVADVAHHLKGVHFPAKKQDLVNLAKQNGASRDIMPLIDGMPDQEFGSIAEVMKAMGPER